MAGTLQVELGGALRPPRGGFILRPPGGRIRSCVVNGNPMAKHSDTEARVQEFPARILLVQETARA